LSDHGAVERLTQEERIRALLNPLIDEAMKMLSPLVVESLEDAEAAGLDDEAVIEAAMTRLSQLSEAQLREILREMIVLELMRVRAGRDLA
jgi:hypothetical protein